MTVTDKVRLLQDALDWALSEGARAYDDRISDGGCGCCSGTVEPPAHLKEIFDAAISRAKVKVAS